MEQHPVPQQISSYQFRLVGDMTLKQFFQLAGGALVSLLIYATNLHPIIKWPLVIFFVLFGAALAFLPFEERPLEVWIVAFFRSIYSPTIFVWKRSAEPAEFFQAETVAQPGPGQPPTTPGITPGLRLPFLSQLEETEQKFLSQVGQLFGPAPAIHPVPTAPTAEPVLPQDKQRMVIPRTVKVSAAPQGFQPKMVVEEKKPVVETPVVPLETPQVGQVLQEEKIQGQAAQFSPEAAPPIPPTQPNIIVGQVMDPDSKIVEGAILEIKDEFGRAARALKTNRAGHFLIVTPLANGKYELIPEKQGLIFDPIIIETKGEIIPPLAIKAKSREMALVEETNNQKSN